MNVWQVLALSLGVIWVVSCGNLSQDSSYFQSEATAERETAEKAHTRSVLIANTGSRDWQQVVNKIDQVSISPVDQIKNLEPLGEMKRLQILDLANNGFTAAQLEPVSKIKSLQIVLIEGNQLTQALIDALAQLPSMHLIYHAGNFNCPTRASLKCVGSGDLNRIGR